MPPIRRFRKSPLLLALVVVMLAARLPAFASSGLEVTILDGDSGKPVPSVAVLLTNDAIGFTARAETNSQGKVRFPSLSTAGSYRVAAIGETRYADSLTEGIALRTDEVRSLTLSLARRQTISETVVSRARPSATQINTIQAEVSATLRTGELRELAVEGRDLTRALFRLPNVTQATGFYPEAPNVSINGANSLYANYLIDGLDNNENFLGGQKFPVPLGFVQDVTVLTSSYSAEFGRTGNGIFNVTSRSGGNRLAGEVFWVTRPGSSLDASSSFAGRDLSGNAVRDGFRRQQFGFGIGGAIRKDRTFYYLNAETTRDDKDNLLNSPALGVNDTVEGSNGFDYYSMRLDHYWRPDLKTTVRVNRGDVEIDRQGGGLEGGVTFPSAGNTQLRTSTHAAVQTTFTRGRFVSDSAVQFSRFDWNYARVDTGSGPQVTVLDPSESVVAVLGHPGFVFDETEKTVQLRQKFTLARGNHTLRAGGDFIHSDFRLRGGGNPDGNYRVRLTDPQLADLRAADLGASLDVNDLPADAEVLSYDVELRPVAFGEDQEVFGVWAEDLWSVNSRLNLTFGLRYDVDSLSRGGGNSRDDDNLAPRTSFNYKLDDRSVIRGGAGLFYDRIVYAIHSDALQQNTTSAGYRSQIQALVDRGLLPANTDVGRLLFDGNVVASVGGVDYLDGPTATDLAGERENVFSNERRILNPSGYDNPQTWQYTLGYQRQLREDMLFYVDLIHTRSSKLFRLRNLNAPEPWYVGPDTPIADAVRSAAEADATRPLADLGAVPGGALNIVMTESAGRARYSAATVTLLRDRGTSRFSYRLSYTLSELENDTDDINFRAVDSNRFGDEWGPSVNDRTHVLSGLLQFHPLPSVTLSLAALLQSGQPVNRIPDASIYGTGDLNGDGRSFSDAYLGNNDRQPGESRNSDRLPGSEVFDLGVRWLLPRVRSGNVELSMDVFNLFNSENLSGYSNNATQSNQIQIGPRSNGIVKRNEGPRRQFQFGVRYVF